MARRCFVNNQTGSFVNLPRLMFLAEDQLSAEEAEDLPATGDHRPDFVRIELVLAGTATYHAMVRAREPGRSLVCRPGELFIFHSALHEWRLALEPMDGVLHRFVAVIGGRPALDCGLELIQRAGHHLGAVALDEWLDRARELLPATGRRDDRLSASRSASLAWELCARIIERHEDEGAGGSDAIAGAKRYLLANLDRPPTITQIARRVGMPPATFKRHFAHSTGESPARWLLRNRLELAHSLLADSGLTVDDVARRYGFANSSSLARAYRRVYGQSPRGHR